MSKRLEIDRNSPGNEKRHYDGKYQPIDFIENWQLGFTEGCIVKYISRHKKKNGKEDVKKTVWYLSVLKARVQADRFERHKITGSISLKEFSEAQQLGIMEENILYCLMDALKYGHGNRIDDAINYAVDLLRCYEETGAEIDEMCGGDEPEKTRPPGAVTPRRFRLIEDDIFDANPSPQGALHPRRFHLDDEREGRTVRFQIGDQHGYFTVNTFADGAPGEVFIRLGKEGAESHGFADMWAIAVSMLLQYGVDPRKIYDKFKFQQFEPAGLTGVKKVSFCKSIPDLVMKWMEKSLIPTKQPDIDAEYGSVIEQAVEKQ